MSRKHSKKQNKNRTIEAAQKQKTEFGRAVFRIVSVVIFTIAGTFIGLRYYDFFCKITGIIGGVCTITGLSVWSCWKSIKSTEHKKWFVAMGTSFIMIVTITIGIKVLNLDSSSVMASTSGLELKAALSTAPPEEQPVIISDAAEDFHPGPLPDEVQEEDVTLSADGFVKNNEAEKLFRAMGVEPQQVIKDTTNGEQKEDIKQTLAYNLKLKIATGTQPTEDEVNGNKEFTSKTERANELSQQLDEKIMDVDMLIEIISLREAAYDIYQTKSLRKLLANNHQKLGKYYYSTQNTTLAFEKLLASVKYEAYYLEMMSADNAEYYRHIYNMGMVYHLIGDIVELNQDCRMQAYFISTCLLEIAADNLDSVTEESSFFYSSYYAGMVNHKLVSYTKAAKDDSCYIYIMDALRYYRLSLEAENMRGERSSQHRFITQICQNGKWYHTQVGHPEKFPTWSEFNKCEEEHQTLL